jgi:predicted DNA-binding transcriptional regulator AlpA
MNDINKIPRILRWKQVSEIIPWSRSYAYDLMSRGLFPRPVKLIAGGQAVGWLSADIESYMRTLAENMGSNRDE